MQNMAVSGLGQSTHPPIVLDDLRRKKTTKMMQKVAVSGLRLHLFLRTASSTLCANVGAWETATTLVPRADDDIVAMNSVLSACGRWRGMILMGYEAQENLFLIIPIRYNKPLGTHCKPIFPYAPCWPVFFLFFFQRRRAWSEAIGFYVSLAQRAIEASQKSLTAVASSISEASWKQENHMISEKPCHWSHSLFLARQAKADLMLCWHFVSVLNQWWI